jgi:hypothetical protein
VYGYGARTPQEKVKFWYDALWKPPLATLLHYAQGEYRGWDVSVSAIRGFYAALARSVDVSVLQGSMKDRPPARAKRHAESPVPRGVERWGKVFGREIHVDEVGGYLPLAYGWMRVQFFAVDMGYTPPYMFLDSRRVRVEPKRASPVVSGGGTLNSMRRLIEHYRMHGHHVDVWNEPIAAVRSDPGSSFRGEELADLLEKERIHPKVGVSGAHYQNGGAERHIQTMLNKVTTAYAEARHVPRELHPYAIQLYVDVSRTWTLHPDQVPVGEAFTGKRHDFINRPLFRWGQPLLVFIPKPHRDWKFGVHSFMAMYVGLPPQEVKEGVLVYNPATKHVVMTRVYRVVDEIPDEWDIITGPLPGYMPGFVDSKEALEAYLALQDPDKLPYQPVDADENDDLSATITPQEVTPSLLRDDRDQLKKEIVSQQEVLQAPSDVVVEPRRLVRPSVKAGRGLLPHPVLRRPLLGQPSTPVIVRSASVPSPPVRVSVVSDSRKYVHGVDDPLFLECPRYQYRLLDDTTYVSRIFKMTLKPTGEAKPRVVRHPDHPTMKMAMEGPYRNFVEEAVQREMSQYTETFPAIHIFNESEMRSLKQAGYNFRWALTSHMDITYKRDPFTNSFLDAKARLCVHGDEDDKYDFSDIKSPTVRAATVKLLLSLLAKVYPNGKTSKARTFDAKGAFLQNTIADRNASKSERDSTFVPEDPIVIRLPDGRYGLLLAYVYGLRQASREFQLQNDALLRRHGYLVTPDPCLYMKTQGEDRIYVALHVDDFLAVGTSDELLDELDLILTERYGTIKRGVGNTLTYLGMVIEITPEGHVDVSGPGTATELLNKYRSGAVPVDDYPMLASMMEQSGDDIAVDATVYRGLIGSVNYYQSVFRPDLAYLVSVGASHMQSAKGKDWRLMERGVRYIAGTEHLKMRFHRDSDFRLYGWADASFQTRLAMRSQTGYCFSVGARNAMFYVKSQLQTPIAQSSTEAEYIALHQCVSEAVWLRQLVKAMLLDGRPVVLYQDNTSTIQWAAGVENFHRTKHIARRYHFTREAWADGIVEIRYCPTEQMVADILTKPLIGEQFAGHRRSLLGLW